LPGVKIPVLRQESVSVSAVIGFAYNADVVPTCTEDAFLVWLQRKRRHRLPVSLENVDDLARCMS